MMLNLSLERAIICCYLKWA